MSEQTANTPRNRSRQLVPTIPYRLSSSKDADGSINLVNDRDPMSAAALINDADRYVPQTVAVQISECDFGTHSRSEIIALPES
jgi:hypothetical protein